MAAVPAGCSRGPWDWWEWQKRDQPRVLPRPSSRVPLARTNFWLSLLGLLAKIKCARAIVVTSDPRGLFGLSGFLLAPGDAWTERIAVGPKGRTEGYPEISMEE